MTCLPLPHFVAAIVIGGMCWWTLSGGLSTHESYLVWMRVYAAIYAFMEFDPAKLVAIETGLGGTVQMPLGVVEQYPPVVLAWEHITTPAMPSALPRARISNRSCYPTN